MLGLDGMPLALATQAANSGVMPNLARLFKQGNLAPLDSIIPTDASAAWATYATGVGPGKHGVFGFVDREPNPFTVHIPSSNDLSYPPIWEILSQAGKRVGVVNVPLTYPPHKLNGIMVACELSPDLAKATYPVELAPRLMELDYRIGPQMGLAASDTAAFLEDLGLTMSRRFAATFELMRMETWDFFQLNISACDRLNHFFWNVFSRSQEAGDLAQDCAAFYRRLDSYLGELWEHLPGDCIFALVSEHGFSDTRNLIYVNRWLEENGYLIFARGKRELINMHPESTAYSLVPGRVYINLKGREEHGSVEPGQPYEDLRDELIHRLGGISHPQTGDPLLRKVYRREELYQGPQLSRAADLIIEPETGYDLKANLDAGAVLGPPDMPGMHSREGGFVCLSESKPPLNQEASASLVDLAPTFLSLLQVELPPDMDGRSLI
ncbi:MAG: alkaline phosphatase family protein [Desulfarculaceae bacterium]